MSVYKCSFRMYIIFYHRWPFNKTTATLVRPHPFSTLCTTPVGKMTLCCLLTNVPSHQSCKYDLAWPPPEAGSWCDAQHCLYTVYTLHCPLYRTMNEPSRMVKFHIRLKQLNRRLNTVSRSEIGTLFSLLVWLVNILKATNIPIFVYLLTISYIV